MTCTEDEKLIEHGLVGTLGGVCWKQIDKQNYEYRATVEPMHLNSAGATHGGFIMTFLDTGLGMTVAHTLRPEQRAVTISLNVQFLAPTTTGDELIGTARITKRTRSLYFMSGTVRVGNNIVATGEGIWKLI